MQHNKNETNTDINRRDFFKKTALAGMSALLIPKIARAGLPGAALAPKNTGIRAVKNGDIILFQGDSITDWGRDRKKEDQPNQPASLGNGYALYTAAQLLVNQADKDIKIYNRGISGNKVYQLAERWDKDCIDLKPDILSILIGINDFWHTKTNGYTGTAATYESDYRALLHRTRLALPDVRIIICEPFIIHGGTAPDSAWESAFAPYQAAAKRLASDFQLTFVPFQSVFNQALKQAGASHWGPDGVHPSMAGAQLMAQAWLKFVF